MTMPRGYQQQRLLYQSAKTRVWLATRDGQPFVLKTAISATPARQRAIHWEYQMLRRIDDPHVVRPIELVDEPGICGLAFEHRPGFRSLANVGPLPVQTWLMLAAEIARAVASVHAAGVLHNDIQPANILAADGLGEVVLLDFKMATLMTVQAQHPAPAESFEGSLHYMAPERTGRTNRAVDLRADLYALGVTLYELLTGRLPFAERDPTALVHAHVAKHPPAPSSLNHKVPKIIDGILGRLLAKSPDGRYQSAHGVEYDLKRCAEALAIEDEPSFALGQQDDSEAFRIPDRLYGRAAELKLIEQTRQAARSEANRVLFISGSPGVGKTKLVTHAASQWPRNVNFVVGKAAQYRRNVPFNAITSVFEHLFSDLSSASSAHVERIRTRLNRALGGHGQLLLDVAPSASWVLGDQPRLPALGGDDARARSISTFSRALRCFCGPKSPLVVFIDDLQWADQSTLEFVRSLAQETSKPSMMLIAAYRDDDGAGSNPVATMLEEIRSDRVVECRIHPLKVEDVTELVADLTNSAPHHEVLAERIHERSVGSPLFATQMLCAAFDQGLLRYSSIRRGWTWDLAAIETMSAHDDVVDFLLKRLEQLQAEEVHTLAVAACIGRTFDLDSLSKACGTTPHHVAQSLARAIELGYIVPQAGTARNDAVARSYQFAHDRIEQAVASLLGPERAAIHLKIARHMLQEHDHPLAPPQLSATSDHINKALPLVEDTERIPFAQICAAAGTAAASSGAADGAVTYFRAASYLLRGRASGQNRALAYTVATQLAQALYLTGARTQGDDAVNTALRCAQTTLERAAALTTKVLQLTRQGEVELAIELGLEALNQLGVPLRTQPSSAAVAANLLHTKVKLRGLQYDDLVNLPKLVDPASRVALDLINATLPSIYQSGDTNLFAMATFRLLQLAIEDGITAKHGFSFAAFGVLHIVALGDLETASKYSRAGVEMAASDPSARTYALFTHASFVQHWLGPLQDSLQGLADAFASGIGSGESQFARYSAFYLTCNELWSDATLAVCAEQAATTELMMRQASDAFAGPAAAIRTAIESLRDTRVELSVDALRTAVARTTDTGRFAVGFVALVVGFLLDDAGLASWGRRQVRRFESADPCSVNFRQSIVLRALTATVGPQRLRDAKAADEAIRALRRWAKKIPTVHRPALLLAQGARRIAVGSQAEALVDLVDAIEGLDASPCLRGIASELAGMAHLAQDNRHVAAAMLRNARDTFASWGALAKVRKMDEKYGDVIGAGIRPSVLDATTAGFANPTHLATVVDISTVVRASQVLSQEIVTDRLINRLLRFVLENAGGQRAALWLRTDADWLLAATGTVSDDGIDVDLESTQKQTSFPDSALRTIRRTASVLLVNDAQTELPWCDDPVIVAEGIRSMLCVPILQHGKLVAAVYVDHVELSHCFAHQRAELLRTLGAQMAISLDNAQLYASLERKVQERTQALERASANMRAIVDNVQFGFLTVDRDLRVEDGHTKSCHKLLTDHEIAGRDLRDVLGLTDEQDRFEFSLRAEDFYTGLLPPDVISEMFPRRVVREQKVLFVDPRPICDPNAPSEVSRLLFSITDISELEKTRSRNKTNETLLRILRSRGEFRWYLDGVLDLLQEARSSIAAGDDEVTRRIFHTIKGNSRIAGLDDVAQRVQAIEGQDAITHRDVERIRQGLLDFLRDHFSVLGITLERDPEQDLTIPRAAWCELAAMAQTKINDASLDRWITLYSSPTAREIMGPVEPIMESLARRKRREIQLLVTGDDVRIESERLTEVVQQAVELVRQRIQTGVEPRGERGDKPTQATIVLRLRRTEETLEIEVEDDGFGHVARGTLISLRERFKPLRATVRAEAELGRRATIRICASLVHGDSRAAA